MNGVYFLWLALILWLMYVRVYRDAFLRYWALSLFFVGLHVVGHSLVLIPRLTGTTRLLHIAAVTSTPEVVCVVLAGVSLWYPKPGAWRVVSVAALTVLGRAAFVAGACALFPHNYTDAVRSGMAASTAAAIAGFCLAFWYRHPLARTLGGRVTAAFSALHAVYFLLLAIPRVAFLQTGRPSSLLISVGIMPIGTATGLILLALQELASVTRAHRESEERYRALVEASPDAITAATLDGTILMCNRQTAGILGYGDPEDLVGRPAAGLMAPVEWDAVSENFKRAAVNGGHVRFECQLLHRDGSAFPVEMTAAPFRDHGGEIVGTISTARDITERKRADEALAQQREFSERVIDSVPGTFFVVDKHRRFVRWNKAVEILTGAGPEAVAAASALDAVHEDDREQAAAAFDRALATGAADIEVRVLTVNKEVRNYLVTARRLMAGGEPYLVACGIDITERRRAQEARAKLEEQLAQAQRLESVGRLAGGVAHDFNNYLTVINGYCDLLLEGLSGGDPSHRMLTEIRGSGERAATLTRQLLAFGRRQALAPKPISLNDIVSSLAGILRRLVTERVSIQIALAPDLGTAMADPGQMEQVLMNLAANARDAMPNGGRLIIETANADLDEVHTEGQPPLHAGRCVMLAVSDTGTGMDERTRKLVFEPFFTTKAVGKGTGLGLATVYGIVQQSGGSIWVYSELGTGTTFKVYLPRIEREASTVRDAAPVADGVGGQETLLLVEDEDSLRTMLATVLRSHGYTVLTAANGRQALDLIQPEERQIDLVVTDVVMPEMSGFELVDRLAAAQRTPRVLFISGYTAGAIGHRDVLPPGAGYLAKPFSPAQILAKVREVLSAGKGRSAS